MRKSQVEIEKEIQSRIDRVIETIMSYLDIQSIRDKFLDLIVSEIGPLLSITRGRIWEARKDHYECVKEIGESQESVGKTVSKDYPPIRRIIEEGFVIYSQKEAIADPEVEGEIKTGFMSTGVAIGDQADLIGGFTVKGKFKWQRQMLERMLKRISRGTSIALHNAERYQQAVKDFTDMERQMLIARIIQEKLLPKSPRFEGFDIYGKLISSKYVGGDYYNFLNLGDAGLGIAIADVAGKGLPAALLTNTLDGALGMKVQDESKVNTIVRRLNNFLTEKTSQETFITFFYGELSREGLFSYCNAGHNAPLLFSGQQISELDAGGPPLGLVEKTPYRLGSVQMEKGDILVLFTDGISEAPGQKGGEFGVEQIKIVVSKNRGLKAIQLANRIFNAVEMHQWGYVGDELETDDKTLIVVRYLASD
ncbi:SpoIIE family protein phosphatase, partial [candidate division KSB1 bacterium]|nr:SpoIIE family protein phosphatase [candidate division KSB1 bacterium]